MIDFVEWCKLQGYSPITIEIMTKTMAIVENRMGKKAKDIDVEEVKDFYWGKVRKSTRTRYVQSIRRYHDYLRWREVHDIG